MYARGWQMGDSQHNEPKTTAWHLIEIVFDDIDERDRAFYAIEKLLGDMGQIGTLSARTEFPNAK